MEKINHMASKKLVIYAKKELSTDDSNEIVIILENIKVVLIIYVS